MSASSAITPPAPDAAWWPLRENRQYPDRVLRFYALTLPGKRNAYTAVQHTEHGCWHVYDKPPHQGGNLLLTADGLLELRCSLLALAYPERAP